MKPSIPKGTRDFSPAEMLKRNFIFDTIRAVYQRYGYEQIETPAMENLSTLEGKYGEEGDKLLFRILNSGDPFEKYRQAHLEIKNSDVTEKGLRYDLTVPFARYVVMHQNEISFPFKRYQIQPVWRADRPQKGRYREFYQCDADVIGSTSLLNELELIRIIEDVFDTLKIDVLIKLNNRKILSGIAEVIGEADKIIDITVAIDKLDKIGLEKVNDELKSKGLSETAVQKLQPIILLKGSNENKLESLKNVLKDSAIGKKGIEEIETIFNLLQSLKRTARNLELDITLARGLDYYTGAIIEVKPNDERSSFTSSICGGGRYDDLTGIFGLPNVSGVGISFGADRIYDVLEEVQGFPDFSGVSTKILFVNFGEEEAKYCLQLVERIREDGINAELFPDAAKMKKQMGYADAKKIPFVALIGTEEMKNGEITVKNMSTGEQSKVTMEILLHMIK
ncbi:MAG: histidine--tRNA ligase [Bacteroidetes bacterium]|jgi:histidyl-tRNA synthetase|nr:histidine--tRNA ligase [Bacteroidota bacterium]MBK9540846.1 histidine--tRNA ligase [Bacteroidota bacterium]MBP6402767.1 histidine--tRNA ligase [Bacteroidia bacterium]MBP6648645.1 histidine--tRNA ligase [Bacteroidia bacterium]